ncbi:MAG: hypothetical protein CBC68_02215 [Candidatus Marinimicrobia bacterium TMED108]|nr:MAG: hypothetical protein CBC68_02215 [Candidatus Marinimicrobia bacterium TMED108]
MAQFLVLNKIKLNEISLAHIKESNMKCLSCSHNWKRTKLTEYVSLLASCPNCGSRLLARNDFILSIVNAIKKVLK